MICFANIMYIHHRSQIKKKLDDRRKLTAESHLRPHGWSSADLELDFSASLKNLKKSTRHTSRAYERSPDK